MDPKNVLVTLGAQNALYLIAELLIDQSTRVVLEEPCYPDLLDIVQKNTDKIARIEVDEGGLILDEDVLSRCDVLFITPSHQCPTTATMPTARRKALLALAQKHDFLVVEDDYEFEMNFLAATSPALKSLDQEGRVLYVGSFSKSMFPGLRLGYMAATSKFIERARELRHLMFRHPPGHSQRTAAYFMALGYYNSQILRLKRVLARRRAVMQNALDECGLSNSSAARFGGTSFWIEGPEWLDAGILAEKLREQSVLIEPGAPFYANRNKKSNHFRAAYSSIIKKHIPQGVRLIRDAIDQLAP
jgi:GntR family transcriptional regulator/MocR family aminotransferase